MSHIFFLQDGRGLVGENLMFWAKGGGYTSDLRQADPFSKDNAVAQHRIRQTDIPWPADYLHARFYTPVDMQYLSHVDRNCKDVAFYRQLPDGFIGNDILWVTADEASTDLRCARVFGNLIPGCVMWPVEEIQKIARPAVRACDASINEALKGTGITLSKPERPKRQPYQCCHCGRFMREEQQYGPCPNCGGDNMP